MAEIACSRCRDRRRSPFAQNGRGLPVGPVHPWCLPSLLSISPSHPRAVPGLEHTASVVVAALAGSHRSTNHPTQKRTPSLCIPVAIRPVPLFHSIYAEIVSIRGNRYTGAPASGRRRRRPPPPRPAFRLAAVFPLLLQLSSPDRSDGRGAGPTRPAAGRRARRPGGAGERPPHHRARPLRRRRAQQQGQRDARVREAGEGEAAGGVRVHALLHHRGEGRRRQEDVRGQGVGEGMGELQAARGIQAGRGHRERLRYIYDISSSSVMCCKAEACGWSRTMQRLCYTICYGSHWIVVLR